MKPQISHSQRPLSDLLRVPFLSVMEHVRTSLSGAGYDDLRSSHLAVFQHIDENSGSHLTELAERAAMTKQSMGYLVDYLEERGYVERIPDPEDGRGKIVRLTQRGRGVISGVRTAVRGLEEEWIAVIGARRMQSLRETLAELGAVLEGAESQASPRGNE